MSAPSCETCKDTKWITGADAMPCPDCQPASKPETVSEPYLDHGHDGMNNVYAELAEARATIERQAGEIQRLQAREMQARCVRCGCAQFVCNGEIATDAAIAGDGK